MRIELAAGGGSKTDLERRKVRTKYLVSRRVAIGKGSGYARIGYNEFITKVSTVLPTQWSLLPY